MAIRIAASVILMIAGVVSGAFALLYLLSSAGVMFGAACAVLAGCLLYAGNRMLASATPPRSG